MEIAVSPFPADTHCLSSASSAEKPQALEGTFKLAVPPTCHLRPRESSQQEQHAWLKLECCLLGTPRRPEVRELSTPICLFQTPPWQNVCSRLVLLWRADHSACPMELTVVTIMGMLAHYLTLCSLYEAPQEKFLSDFSTKKSCNSLEQEVCFYLMDTGNCVRDMVSFSFWLRESLGTSW